jgi:hypothetical protein
MTQVGRCRLALAVAPARAAVTERNLLYGRYRPRHAITSVWDNRLARGTALDNAFTTRAKLILIESGPGRVGRWLTDERNLYDDYGRVFAGDPPRIAGIALMRDTDGAGERAVAYYGRIALRGGLSGPKAC